MKKKVKTLRPIRANRGVTAWYKRRILNLVTDMRKSVSWWLMAELRKTENAKELHNVNTDLFKQWDTRFKKAADTLAHEFVRKTYTDTTKAFQNALNAVGFDVKLRQTPEVTNILNSLRFTQVDLIRSIPAKALDEVAGIVQRGVQNGRDIYTVQSEIEKHFDVTDRRARVIAIDQNNKATAAIHLAHAKEAGITEAIWMHVPGRKTSRPEHVAMHGKKFKLFGIDAGLYDKKLKRNVMPAECVNCFTGDSQLNYSVGIKKLFRRFYAGELSEIVTDDGIIFRVTPNHPILTVDGWKGAQFLNSGDYVVGISKEKRGAFNFNGDNAITKFSDIFNSFVFFGISPSILDAVAGKFHGDMGNSEIHIINTDSALLRKSYSGIIEKFAKFNFTRSEVAFVFALLTTDCAFDSLFMSLFSASQSGISGFCDRLSIFFRSLTISEFAGFFSIPDIDAVINEACPDCPAVNAVSRSNFIFRYARIIKFYNFFFRQRNNIRLFRYCHPVIPEILSQNTLTDAEHLGDLIKFNPGCVKLKRIISNSKVKFSGHVFNIETENNYYITNNVIAHNCACEAKMIIPD